MFLDDNVPPQWHDFIDLNAEMAPLSPRILERKAPLAGPR
ncbi:MAG: DUF3470 domain-containing protein [Pirellulaceae bacterium]